MVIKESEHSRGELLACCHRRAITGLVQKLANIEGPDWLRRSDSVATAKSTAIEESEQDEKHVFSKLVAVAAGSRGSRLSVFEMARRRYRIRSPYLLGCTLSMHTATGFNSSLSSVAKLSSTSWDPTFEM
jgi:hypothetical protein